MEPARWSIHGLMDIVTARRHGREMALALGFSLPDATKIAVVISELAREILENAQAGTIALVPHTGKEARIEILAHLEGRRPGDSEQVGGSRSTGVGAGLRGVGQLVDEFDVRAENGGGATITAMKRRR